MSVLCIGLGLASEDQMLWNWVLLDNTGWRIRHTIWGQIQRSNQFVAICQLHDQWDPSRKFTSSFVAIAGLGLMKNVSLKIVLINSCI